MKLKTNDFDKCLTIGNIGEKFTKDNFLTVFKPILINYLYSKRYEFELNELFQKAGEDGETGFSLFKWEVKTRTRFYPDILLELKHSSGKLGWFFYTEADIITYLYLNEEKEVEKGFLLIMCKLKDYFTMERLKQYHEIKSNSNRGENNWHTINVAIPFNDFPRNSLISIPDLKYLKNIKTTQKFLNQFIKKE